MKEIKEQIEMLKEYYNVKTQKELAETLGIKEPNINYWINHGKIPFKYLQVLGNIEEHKVTVDKICDERYNYSKKMLIESADKEKIIERISKECEYLNNIQLVEIYEKAVKFKFDNIKK
jgi:hypothetical protein